MAVQDPEQILVAGNLRLHSAAVGTTLPTELPVPAVGATPEDLKLDAAFNEVGFTSPEGSVMNYTPSTEGIPVHQRLLAARTIVTGVEANAQFVLREWTTEAVKLGFGGGTVSEPTAGVFRYDPPDPGTITEFTFVLDLYDEYGTWRWVFERAIATGTMTVNFVKTAAADLPVTLTMQAGNTVDAGFYALTDWASLDPAGS